MSENLSEADLLALWRARADQANAELAEAARMIG